MHWAAILAGGVGSRFWPLSTPERPKQLLPLAGDAPLVVQAVRRLRDLVPAERVLVITGAALAPRIAQLLPDIPRDQILVEPRAASTAPALTWAAHWIRARDPNASLLSLHADWAVGDDAAFRTTGRAALDTAGRHDLLVTVGIKPTRVETGYGYIVPGKRLDKFATRVASFVEKPTVRRAASLRKRGALWNCGLFAWTVSRFLAEVKAWAREVAPGLPALDQGNVDAFFTAVKPIAVDVAVLERTPRLAVVRGTFPWDDVGTWTALPRVRRPDARGNVSVGGRRVALRDARGCIVWAEEGHVVVDGASDLVVVQANGITLVTTRDRAPDLKALLETLPPELRGGTT